MWLERFRLFTRTSIWRFTLIFTFIVLLISTSILTIVYQFTIGEQKRQLEQQVNITAQGFADLASTANITEKVFISSIEKRVNNSASIVLVMNSKNELIGNLQKLPLQLPEFPILKHFPIVVIDHLGESTVEIILGTKLSTQFGELVVGLFDKNYQTQESNFFSASTLALTLALIVTLITGWLFNRRVLFRVNQIARLTAQVKAGHLKTRLPLTNRRDEFDAIALQINQMLDEIDGLIDSVAQVTDNVAHDLRTPLSRIRITVEDSLKKSIVNSDDEQWRLGLLEEIDQVIDTFNAMLELSRLEKGVLRSSFEIVDISTLCYDVIDLAGPLAEEKQQKLVIEIKANEGCSDSTFKGEANLIFRAIYNVVENAIKYTQIEGCIALTCHFSREGIEIIICDNGPGISKENHDAVFQRLYQLDSSRQSEGFGLGLPIVKAIIELHGGTITLSSLKPGLKATISLKQ